ncbi:hypothetical protein [uncultured Granulicatella sp.]|jgi:hypothetical protein|uniref:hypothetical protein n=1 Tax=uncultured Granulicatella sp. TaxID=316089 RepID=UPI002622003A|nr:hypothetical protein [uncultured Granulicatella sp.]
MRVQISFTIEEYDKLLKQSKIEGYPDVISYAKDRLLHNKNFLELWEEVTSKIENLESGMEFTLRDLVSTPPANLGVKLFQNQKMLGIIKIGKDNLNSNIFKKV